MIAIKLSGKEVLTRQTAQLQTWIACLKKKDIGLFRDFLNSPYLNKDDRLLFLFNYFYRAMNNNASRINGKQLLSNLFGTIPKGDSIEKLSKLLPELQKLLKLFFVYQESSDKDNNIYHRALVMNLKKQGSSDLFHKVSEHYRQKLKKQPVSIMQLSEYWWLEHQNYFYQNARHYLADGNVFSKANFYLEKFSLLARLRYYCEYLNRHHLLKDNFIFERLEQKIEKDIQQTEKEPIIQLYITTIQMLKDRENHDLYLQMKGSFKQYQEYLAFADQLVFIKMVIKRCIFCYEKGFANAAEEAYYWVLQGLDANIFLFEGILSDGEYLNVALIAAAAGKFEWQLTFIDNYREYLEENCQDKAYQLAMGYYRFHQGYYQETIKLIKNWFPKYAHEEPILIAK